MKFSLRALLLATTLVAIILAGRVRGEHLGGLDPSGILWAVVCGLTAVVTWRGFTTSCRFDALRRIVAGAFAAFVLACSFAPDAVREPIRAYKQFSEAWARMERERMLTTFLQSIRDLDPRFAGITCTLCVRQSAFIEIRGTVARREDLQLLGQEWKPHCSEASVFWDVVVSETGERFADYNEQLFADQIGVGRTE